MKIYDMKKTGVRMAKLRLKANLTQAAAAEQLCIATITLSRIERGTKGCSVDLLIAMSELYNVSLDYLVLGEPTSRICIKDRLDSLIDQLSDLRDSL